MNYFDMNNLLLSQKFACGFNNNNNDNDSLASTEIRDRALSNSSVSSQDSLSSNAYYQQNSIKDLNFLLALLAQNSQQQTPLQSALLANSTQTGQFMTEKGRSNSDASQNLQDEFKGLMEFNGFANFSQNQFDRKTGAQVFIPKPIRSVQKSNSIFSQSADSPSQNNQSSVQNMLLEASLNIFQNLIRKEATSSELEQQTSSLNQTSNNSPAQPQQSSIQYQPNIIFGVQLSPEDMQKRRELRRAKIEKYLHKKETRKWDVLRYEVRKKIAKTRQRIKGRFVKEEIKPNSDDSQQSNPQNKSPNSTEFEQSCEQVNSVDNI